MAFEGTLGIIIVAFAAFLFLRSGLHNHDDGCLFVTVNAQHSESVSLLFQPDDDYTRERDTTVL